MPQSLAEWLTHLDGLRPRGENEIDLGLQRVARLATPAAPSGRVLITVGGTNGKGSLCAMLESILLAAGYRVGLFTSPHLLHYNERVRVNGAPVDDALLCEAFADLEQARGDTALTWFEFGALAAWRLFAQQSLDVVILEVGLGGRLDAVNVFDADCAIVSNVALDHMDYLGDTREAIGFEKAGIFRRGRPAICGDADAPQSLVAHAAAIGARLQLIGRDFSWRRFDSQWSYRSADGRGFAGLAFPALRGERQLDNAACAIAALEQLRQRLPVSAREIRLGLARLELPGRCQLLPGKPQVVLDVAHNPDAVAALARSLGAMPFAAKTWAVFGMLKDKDIDAVIAAIQHRIDVWLPCTLAAERGASAALLAQKLQEAGVAPPPRCFDSVGEALQWAAASIGADDRIAAFGSFLTVADSMRFFARRF